MWNILKNLVLYHLILTGNCMVRDCGDFKVNCKCYYTENKLECRSGYDYPSLNNIPNSMMKFLDFRGLTVDSWDEEFFNSFSNLETVNLDTRYNQMEFKCDTLPLQSEIEYRIILPSCGYGMKK